MSAKYDASQKKAIYKWVDRNRDKWNAYMKMYNKLYRYCKTPELIENYEKAKSDNFEGWMIHHRLEEFYSRKELINMGKYKNVPAEELIFVKGQKEHFAQKHKTIPKSLI